MSNSLRAPPVGGFNCAVAGGVGADGHTAAALHFERTCGRSKSPSYPQVRVKDLN